MGPKILVTGGNGFVGRQVVKALRAQDIPFCLIGRSVHEEEGVHTPDLFRESMERLEEACEGVDVVLHLAWYAEPGVYVQSDINLECVEGSIRLAKAAVAQGVKRFVGVGTCFEYDLSIGDLSADSPLRPHTLYGASKAALFLQLSQYLKNHDVEFRWCRLFYLYGENEDPRRLVPYVRTQLDRGEPALLGSGQEVRDYMDVERAGARLVDETLGRDTGPVNICSGRATSVRELTEAIADEFGRRDLLQFGSRPERKNEPPRVVGIP